MKRTLVAAAAAISVSVAAPRMQAQGGWNGVEVWGGIATDSPSWGVLGEASSMNLGVLGLRLSRALGAGERGGRVTEYTMDLIPLATTSPPYISLRGTNVDCARGSLCVARPPMPGRGPFPAGSSHGFGINPAGLTTRFRTNRHISPSLGLAVGGLWFDRHVPTSKSSQFNFTAALEAGLRFGAPGAPGLTLTYRFHHLSNAGTAGENPGLASHLLTAGLRYPVKK